jgi:hypothetical protein
MPPWFDIIDCAVSLEQVKVRRRLGTIFFAAVGCLSIGVGVAAADRCHTPLPGTRSITLHGEVTGYRFTGDRVLLTWSRTVRCAGTIVWNYASAKHTKAATTCQRPATGNHKAAADTKLTASDARHTVRVVLAPSAEDAPDRLMVLDRSTHSRIASWPLFVRPTRVALQGEIAILSGAERQALYALRITDGRIAQLGITRPGDLPQIGPAGVLYQTDLDLKKHRTAPSERTLNLVPLEAIRAELARPFTTVRKYMSYTRSRPPTGVAAQQSRPPNARPTYTGADPPRRFESSPITAIAMDGPRVAMAVKDPSGRCDYVLFWNVGWHYMTRLTRAQGPTCLPTHAPGGITNVAIAGSRAVWTVNYGGTTRVIAAGITDCQEWVVARPSAVMHRVAGLSGDGAVLAYALSPSGKGQRALASVGIVPSFWRGIPIQQMQKGVVGLSAFDGGVAVLRTTGKVSITTNLSIKGGVAPTRQIKTGPSQAVALRSDVLAVLTNRGTLDVYSRDTGRRIHSWRVPRKATALDVQYGTALLTAGRDVYAMSLATGRTSRLFHAPTRVAAQIEAPGAAIQFNEGRRGHIRFVPMSRIEASTR